MLGNVAYAEQAYAEAPPIIADVRVELATPTAFNGQIGSLFVNETIVSGVSATGTVSSSVGVNSFVINGVRAFGEIGTPTVQELNISGVMAKVSVGNPLVWGWIIDVASTTWSPIDPDRDTSYSDIEPDPGTTWTDVGGMNT